jgi:hypothetical protein
MKLHIKKLITLAGITSCLTVLPGIAQAWDLIDNFDEYEDGGIYTIEDGSQVYAVHHNQGLGAMQIFGGIEGANDKAAWFWYYQAINPPGDECAGGAGDAWFHIPLIHEIPMNGTGTIFFRLWQAGIGCPYVLGFTRYLADEVPACAPDWGYQSGVFRFRNDADPTFMDAYSSSGYIPEEPSFNPEIETWYKYWIVINNSFDTSQDPAASTGTYQIWRQGPNDAAPYHIIYSSGDSTVLDLGFRNPDPLPIKAFMMIEDNLGTDDVYLIDDLYSTLGADTTDPTVPVNDTQWCGMDKQAMDTIDTGGFLGWIYVGSATGAPGWVFSYTLNSYVYVASCPGTSGGWVYVPNN